VTAGSPPARGNSLDDQKNEAGQSAARDRPQPERRLARGLEDVSHLFRSQTAKEPVPRSEFRGNRPEPVHAPQPKLGFVAGLRPLNGVNRDQAIALLKDHLALLEEGMRVIDVSIPCEPCGTIDLLAIDAANRLAIIDIDSSVNDHLLMRGIYHFDWLVRNVPIFRRMYRGLLIDYACNPRLFLVAPDYSSLHRCVAPWITSPQISCFKYHAVAMSNGAGILVERA
jgi:hypothetical protein